MTCGIYKLSFNGTNKVYIGQSINIESRFKAHIRCLNTGSHTYKLQNAYKLYGMPQLEILVECSKEELDFCENESIQIWDCIENGFNSCLEAGDTPTLRGELHGRSKFSNIEITEVFNLLIDNPLLTQQEISLLTGVSKDTINDISCGKTHLWLKQAYPDRYPQLEILKLNRNSLRKEQAITKVYPDIKSPGGDLYSVRNISKFAREHGLNRSNLCSMLNGKAKSIKGWVIA